MPDVRYLIVGGGMTADAAVRGIREKDPNGPIALISRESYPPYNRPPLTKALWKGKSVDQIWRGTQSRNVDLHLGRNAKEIGVNNKTVIDDQGTEYRYEKLLIATGGKPRRLPFGENNILYYRTLQNYYGLRDETQKKQYFSVIGGGFVGSEIAAALAMNQKSVTMFFPEDGIGARVFPKDLYEYINDYYGKKGVTVRSGVAVNGLNSDHDQLELILANGEKVRTDTVIAGLGITPNIELAEQAGIKTENGILVADDLQTNIPGIYAAGDVAFFYNPALGKRIRVEHEDNANTMGLVAGRNMAGDHAVYDHLPFFYSDLFELGYEAVGELDSRLEMVEDWQEMPFKKGAIYYLEGDRVRGVLLWNIWGIVDQARALIAKTGPIHRNELLNAIT